MFKSSRLKDSILNFDQQLDKKLNCLKQQTTNQPIIKHHNTKQHHLTSIIDEVVLSLQESHQPNNRENDHEFKFNQRFKDKNDNRLINQISELQMEKESSIQMISAVDNDALDQRQEYRIVNNHISNLVKHQDLSAFLKQTFRKYTQNHSILLIDFIKKAMPYFLDIHLKDHQVYQAKKIVQNELTTTNLDYLSLNALQIALKKQRIEGYLSKIYAKAKIQMRLSELQKRFNKNQKKLIEKQQFLNNKQLELSQLQSKLQELKIQLGRRQQLIFNKQKLILNKSKDLILKQKQLKKQIQDRCMKLYDQNLNKFNLKVKQSQKQLLTLQKNIKYKIQLLERRGSQLKLINAEQADILNKKQINGNQYKIKYRRLQKQMQILQKKYLNKIQQLQTQLINISKGLIDKQQKISKLQHKNKKIKQKIVTIQEQKIGLIHHIKKIEEELLKKQNFKQEQCLNNVQIDDKKVILDKDKREQGNKTRKDSHGELKDNKKGKSSNDEMRRDKSQSVLKHSKRSMNNGKKQKQSQLYEIISLYQLILELKDTPRQQSRPTYQALLQKIMQQSIKHLPIIISMITSQQTQNIHLLILNITNLLILQFYSLNTKQTSLQQYLKQNNNYNTIEITKLNKLDILQLLKCSFQTQQSFSIFIYLLQIINWYQDTSSIFFINIINKIIQMMNNDDDRIQVKSKVINRQLQLLSSSQCITYMVYNHYLTLNCKLGNNNSSSRNSKNNNQNKYGLKIVYNINVCISLIDLILQINKNKQQIISKYTTNNIISIIFITFQLSIPQILNFYLAERQSTITFAYLEPLEQLTEKMSILMQRVYLISCRRQEDDAVWLSKRYGQLITVNKINNNRYKLIALNVKSILDSLNQKIN